MKYGRKNQVYSQLPICNSEQSYAKTRNSKKVPKRCAILDKKTPLLNVMVLSGHKLTCNIKFSDRNAHPGQQKYHYMIETI